MSEIYTYPPAWYQFSKISFQLCGLAGALELASR